MIDALLYLYPGVDFESNIEVRDDGNGPYIAAWNDPRPQPTQAEIEAAILPAAQQKKIDELKSACKAHITSGYTSNALGTTHTYDSDLGKDQSNIIGSIIAGVPLEMTCTDGQGIKAMRLHTVQQIQQVFADGMLKLQAAKARYYALRAQVEAAADVAAVEPIVWTESW